jgi:predicted protein tyrosine phosphatase
MNIVVHNYLSGSFLLEHEPNVWDALVILESGVSHTDFVSNHARQHLYLRFDDVGSNIRGKQMPTLTDIRSAVEFAAHSENLMVCCRAGQSRSVATAFVICHQQLGADAARRLLNPKRHIPNPLIVELGARVIDDPSVVLTFANWQADNRNVRLSDYLDEIEREIDELELQGARNLFVAPVDLAT